MIITSKSNNIVKYVSSLKSKKYRNKYNKYVIEGVKMVEEIINSEGNAPEFIIYSKDILEDNFSNIIDQRMNNVIEVSKEVFEYISDLETPQGILVVVDRVEYTIADLNNELSKNNNEKYIILDKIQDPGNLGTIIRSAIGFGVNNIICTGGTVDPFSPKVVRSSMGGMKKIKIFNIEENEIEKMTEMLKSNNFSLLTTSLDAKESIREIRLDSKCVFVMGNEANGVTQRIFNKSDKLVKIPMERNMESFNVAVAASIAMYEQYMRSEKNAC